MEDMTNMKHSILLPTYLLFLGMMFWVYANHPSSSNADAEAEHDERMAYFLKYESELVPWYHLAAIDQYERNIKPFRKEKVPDIAPLSLTFPADFWTGALNPNSDDTHPASIDYFDGFGQDGNEDGVADPSHPDDAMLSLATYLGKYGQTEDDYQLALFDFYGDEEAVHQIITIKKLYAHFETIALDDHAFPIPTHHHYSYRSTWGAKRGWGGRRIHEGTDLFAGYGVPVQSTAYGIIEIMGWNDYGGWRIGIRDHHNTYHYFAHLASFDQSIQEGDIVSPATVIGYVGSSGYGKQGTTGRFPPHLHYGMYKYDGRTEWSFDPFPSLRAWEQQAKNKK